MSDVKLPNRKPKTVELPERPKDRNEQSRNRTMAKAAELTPSETLQQEKVHADLAASLDNMTDYQKQCAQVYTERLMDAAKIMAHNHYGAGGNVKMGLVKIDEIPPLLTETILKKFKGDVGINEFFAVLGSTAGYQAGLTMATNNVEMTESMIQSAMALFEGGLRVMAESTKTIMRTNKVLRPAPKKIH